MLNISVVGVAFEPVVGVDDDDGVSPSQWRDLNDPAWPMLLLNPHHHLRAHSREKFKKHPMRKQH